MAAPGQDPPAPPQPAVSQSELGVSAMDAAGAGADDAAGPPGTGTKRPRREQNVTRQLLRQLLNADKQGVVDDVCLTLSFAYEGLTYSCNLPASRPATGPRSGPNANFPELDTLLNESRSGAKFFELLKKVVRAR